MHELSICESILNVIEDAARRDGFTRVSRVRLEIGRFAGVEIAALRFGFEVVTRNSLAEGATLEIDEPPGRAWCFDCSGTVTLSDRLAPCPRCGGARLQPTGGDDLRIKDLEVA